MDQFGKLSLAYQWTAGSLPPPGHYEYRIEIEQFSGKISFIPDYPQNDTPKWIENFVCTADRLTCLYEKIDSSEFFAKPWGSRDPHRIGGATQTLDLTINDKTVHIPHDLALHEHEMIQPVFDAVKDLVPRPIWDRLFALRELYNQEHYG
jgi:hypothetical protein